MQSLIIWRVHNHRKADSTWYITRRRSATSYYFLSWQCTHTNEHKRCLESTDRNKRQIVKIQMMRTGLFASKVHLIAFGDAYSCTLTSTQVTPTVQTNSMGLTTAKPLIKCSFNGFRIIRLYSFGKEWKKLSLSLADIMLSRNNFEENSNAIGTAPMPCHVDSRAFCATVSLSGILAFICTRTGDCELPH